MLVSILYHIYSESRRGDVAVGILNTGVCMIHDARQCQLGKGGWDRRGLLMSMKKLQLLWNHISIVGDDLSSITLVTILTPCHAVMSTLAATEM